MFFLNDFLVEFDCEMDFFSELRILLGGSRESKAFLGKGRRKGKDVKSGRKRIGRFRWS